MNQWNVELYDFAVARIPALPENALHDPFPSKGVAITGLSEFEDALQRDLAKVHDLSRDPANALAIGHASPSLGERLRDFSPAHDNPTALKTAIAASKYLSRMSTRCTPFGLMAATAVVKLADCDGLAMDGELKHHTRLDNQVVWDLANSLNDRLLNQPLRGFNVRAGSGIYRIGDQYRFVTKRQATDNSYYALKVVTATHEIDWVLERTKEWVDIDSLTRDAVTELGGTDAEISEFLRELLRRRLLVTELELAPTSGDCFADLARRAAKIACLRDQAEEMQAAVESLRQVTTFNLKASRTIDSAIRQHLANYDLLEGKKNLVHVDAYRNGYSATLSTSIASQLARDISHLMPFMWRQHPSLEQFTRKFSERYGAAEVPLLEVLDPDGGIALGPRSRDASPLLVGAIAVSPGKTYEMSWGPLQRLLLDRVCAAIANGQSEVVLNAEDLGEIRDLIPRPSKEFACTLAAHVSVTSDGAAENSPLFILHALHGPSSLNVLGRFTSGDSDLFEHAKSIARDEQDHADELLAEVVHVPGGRVANILTRQQLRRVEILYGDGTPSTDTDLAINASDLTIRVDQGRLRVRSVSHDCDIRPMLASAHNTSGGNLPAYQLLSALQYQDGYAAGIMESPVFRNMGHLPRIRYGSTIIALERWLVGRSEINRVCNSGDARERYLSLQELRHRRRLPRHVALTVGDNVLEVDLDSPLSSLALVTELAKRTDAQLTESQRGIGRGFASIDGLPHRCELFVPVRTTCRGSSPPHVTLGNRNVLRSSLMGARELPMQDWIYFDIFTGEAVADLLLVSCLGPLLNGMEADGKISKWFYVRYYEGGNFHLRVRLKPSCKSLRIHLLDGCLESLQPSFRSGLISNIRVSGYSPEIDRYGGIDGMALSEAVFHEQSKIAVRLLALITSSVAREEVRWRAGLLISWSLISIWFDEDVRSILRFSSHMLESYRAEMPGSAATNRSISDNYRRHLKHISPLLEAESGDPVRAVVTSGSDFVDRLAAHVAKLVRITDASRRDELLASLVHMGCNRLFAFEQRANEMVLYDYMVRYARSKSARVHAESNRA